MMKVAQLKLGLEKARLGHTSTLSKHSVTIYSYALTLLLCLKVVSLFENECEAKMK